MLGIVNRAFLSRGASLLRPAFVRRMGVEANENPSVNGNVVLLAGVALAVGCGAYVHFRGLVIWGLQPDKYQATKTE